MAVLGRDLEYAGEAEMESILWCDYDVIILDAGVINDLPSTISLIRSRNAEARIVVFSSAPHWKQAREVMLAGAVDYAPKLLDSKYIFSTLTRNLAKRAPPHRR